MSAKVYKPKHPSFTRRWTHPCPVCGEMVRVNKDGTIAAHFEPHGPYYCAGARQPV